MYTVKFSKPQRLFNSHAWDFVLSEQPYYVQRAVPTASALHIDATTYTVTHPVLNEYTYLLFLATQEGALPTSYQGINSTTIFRPLVVNKKLHQVEPYNYTLHDKTYLTRNAPDMDALKITAVWDQTYTVITLTHRTIQAILTGYKLDEWYLEPLLNRHTPHI